MVSGARDLVEKSAIELEELAMGELRRLVPAAHEAKVTHRMVYKARSATFAATPASDALRPQPATEWCNFWLAGDWTDTGYPATIEGAILSGERAARLVDETEILSEWKSFGRD